MIDMSMNTEYIEEMIKEFLPKEKGFQKTILEALNYSILAGGKRLRPLIMHETYRLFCDGPVTPDLKAMMVALEMIHSSSLVHDDLPCMDNDRFRRGKLTTWAKYESEATGVLAGDALMIYAFEVASSAYAKTKNPERLCKAIHILANKTGIYGMIGGQTVDVELTGRPMSAEELDFVFRLKTGALLESAMMIGAVLGGATLKEVEICRKIAENVGVAFQIRDDILDVSGDEAVIGKPLHSDEKNNKTTYVSLYGLSKAQEDVEALTDEAIRLLDELPGDPGALKALFHSMISRNK
ncbi:MAG: polyprenyl synthetase family protein [Lachnospiraceae bacterium]|nr:polyprenyl synthetase family protein [Lachnospiraceae bacterium]